MAVTPLGFALKGHDPRLLRFRPSSAKTRHDETRRPDHGQGGFCPLWAPVLPLCAGGGSKAPRATYGRAPQGLSPSLSLSTSLPLSPSLPLSLSPSLPLSLSRSRALSLSLSRGPGQDVPTSQTSSISKYEEQAMAIEI